MELRNRRLKSGWEAARERQALSLPRLCARYRPQSPGATGWFRGGIRGMFTGIVEELGEVVAIDDLGDAARLTVRGPQVTGDVANGDSIAVNGVCLTVSSHSGDTFTADVMRETLIRSSLGSLAPGAAVNLERSVRLADRLGGHLVQGHVDGTGDHRRADPGRALGRRPRSRCRPDLDRYVVEKGSIAVDGISLTVVAVTGGEWFEVSLIPETLKRTTLGTKQPGRAGQPGGRRDRQVCGEAARRDGALMTTESATPTIPAPRPWTRPRWTRSSRPSPTSPRAARSSSWTTRTGRTRATWCSRPARPPRNCSPSPSGTRAA